jgi:hypothetical protein
MSTLEKSIRYARIGLNDRLNPDRLSKYSIENSLKPPVITPDFFVTKLAELKNISNVIGMEELKKRLLFVENRTTPPSIEKVPDTVTIVKEIPNPHEELLAKLALVNRIMQRGRRGSRCLAQQEHTPENCQGRVHLKKSGASSESRSISQQNIRTVSKSAEGNNKTPRRSGAQSTTKKEKSSKIKPLAA